MKRVSFVVFATLVACNKPPGPPVISITPADPSTADDLQASIDAEAVDPNGDEVSYTYAWYQDGAVRADLVGDAVPESETAKGESWRVVVVPSDGVLDGTADEAETLVLNTPPTCTVELAPASPLTTDALAVTTTGTDDDDDDVTFTYAWTVDGAVTEHDGDTVPADATTKGEVWEVTVTPVDDEEAGEAVTASVTIDNTAPVVESVVLSPEEPQEADVIEATVVASDDDGDTVTLSYAWSVDGVVVQEGEDATLTGELFDKHQEVTVSVTPDDGFTTGDAVASDALTVLNTLPALDSASIDLTEVYEGSTVTCVPSGWQDDDGDAEAYEYAWTVNGVEVATSETLDGGSFDKHDVLACSVTPWDGEEAGETVTSDAVTVLNTAPTLASATLSSTSPVEGDTLSVIVLGENDEDGDEVSFNYAWYVSGAFAAATDTLASSSFAKGDEIYVVVTPTDGEDDGAPVTSDTATVLNTAPEVTSVALSSSDVYTDDTITALVSSTDADGDSVALGYVWTVDGSVVYSGGSALDGSLYFGKEDVVAVSVTPTDGTDFGPAVASTSVTVLNMPPTAPVISIDPAAPEITDDLVCVVDVESVDADEDTVAYTFAWEVDGVAFTGADSTYETGDTVLAEDTNAGEVWVCTVTPDDGSEDGSPDTASVAVKAEVMAISPGQAMSLSEADYAFLGESAGDYAGQFVARAGDVDGDGLDDILISSNGHDDGGSTAGMVYLILGSSLGSSASIDLSVADYAFVGENSGDQAGYSIDGAGDVDGDGLDDILIGAHQNDDAGGAAGKAYLILGSSLGGSTSIDLSAADYAFVGENAGDEAGYTLAGAGDVDGDGLDDILISAHFNDDGGANAGKTYLILGATLGSSTSIDLSDADYAFVGENASDDAGHSVASAGDVDGDGLDDILIGAHMHDDGGSDAGMVYLIFGDSLPGASTIDLSSADHAFVGENSGDYAGISVASAGDLDGDGLDDILIGAHSNDEGGGSAGKAYVVLATDLLASVGTVDLSTADFNFIGASGGDLVGKPVAPAGDVDGDGYSDFLVGAYYADDGGSDAGAVYLVLSAWLPSDGTADIQDYHSLVGEAANDHAGFYVDSAGDVDGDGLDDILIGAYGNDEGGSLAGKAYLVTWPTIVEHGS